MYYRFSYFKNRKYNVNLLKWFNQHAPVITKWQKGLGNPRRGTDPGRGQRLCAETIPRRRLRDFTKPEWARNLARRRPLGKFHGGPGRKALYHRLRPGRDHSRRRIQRIILRQGRSNDWLLLRLKTTWLLGFLVTNRNFFFLFLEK